MRSDRTASKYEIKKVKGSWKLVRDGRPVFTGISKESCTHWLHITTRYPFGVPTDADQD
jgi:hypothetical protein